MRRLLSREFLAFFVGLHVVRQAEGVAELVAEDPDLDQPPGAGLGYGNGYLPGDKQPGHFLLEDRYLAGPLLELTLSRPSAA